MATQKLSHVVPFPQFVPAQSPVKQIFPPKSDHKALKVAPGRRR
jgi:hypothetical protein